MTESKAEILEKLRKITGRDDPAWATWPAYKMLVEIEKHRTEKKHHEQESDDDDDSIFTRTKLSAFKKTRTA